MNVCGRPGEAYVVWGPSRLKCKEIAAPSAGEETVEEKEGEKKKEEKFERSRQKDESRLFGGGGVYYPLGSLQYVFMVLFGALDEKKKKQQKKTPMWLNKEDPDGGNRHLYVSVIIQLQIANFGEVKVHGGLFLRSHS